MSGIVGSKLNIRGSGLVGSLGTDGQHLLSAGAGKTNVFETAAGGYWNLIKSITASSSGTVDFVNGASDVVFDSTYKQYMIRMINVHPQTNGADFGFNASADTGSNYNVVKMVGAYATYHRENDANEAGIQYRGTEDSTQSTAAQEIFPEQEGTDNDSGGSGEIIFYDPSNTTFVKHFISHSSHFQWDTPPYAKFNSFGGYFNTTSAVDAIQFAYTSGNIDSGQFILYGAT